MATNHLVCSNVRVKYPEFLLALDLSVKEGDLITLIGPSGCGKSTTLQLISGLIPCESGEILLNGKDITNLPVWERKIGLVFQEYALFPHLNVERNVDYALRLRRLPKEERKAKTESLLALVNLEGYAKRRVEHLSGGERLRVALARALAAEPHVLLLDEPLSALDEKLRKRLREEIRRIQQETGITMIYVTHDQEEALTISDKVVVMHEGQIEQYGTPEEVYSSPATLFVANFMGLGTLLPTTLISSILKSFEEFEEPSESHLFFRPEDVIVHSNTSLPFPEYLPHLRFKGAKVVSNEYQGGRYLLQCEWEGYTIYAYSPQQFEDDTLTLGVKVQELNYFNLDQK